MVGLLAGAYEFEFEVAMVELGCAIVCVDGELRLAAGEKVDFIGYLTGEFDAAADRDEIHVGRRAGEENVAHEAADDVGVAAERVGRAAHEAERRVVKIFL